jgi:DNA-binding CsgD family transcriptional regulator
MARALRAEAEGDVQLAASVLAPTLDPEFAVGMHLRYLWLPELTRLALAYGDESLARAAADACAEEVKTESTTGKIAAAARCEALISGQVRPLLDAAETYRSLARPLELGQTLEDAAVLLAPDDERGARRAYADAVQAYAELGAAWDIRRADARLRPYGMRRPRQVLSGRPAVGWAALSRTELTIARLVAEGLSNSAIAAQSFIGRSTVETHVAHILAKLGARSRAEIARIAADNTATS